MQRAGLLTIGRFARLSWLSPPALRLYEQQGLLVPAVVDEQTGYRWYGPEQLVEYWSDEEFQLAARRELVSHLRVRLLGQKGTLDMFEVRMRDVPEQLVLTEQRHVRVQELGPWIDEAMARLLKAATGHGDGLTEPCFIVYHGEVNEESDGPVEICLPISPAPDHPVDGAVRVEPAHREAYTRITKAQCAFPQILSAFDVVRLWAESERVPVTGSPREVYFADFSNAAPQDEVCDVAQPIECAGASVDVAAPPISGDAADRP